MLHTDVQDNWLEVDGMRIHYLNAGESGSPVMLLHGGGIDSATLSWSGAIKPLSERHRVFAPDLPGYGLSDTPDISHTTDFYVKFVKHLLDHLHLGKVSLGGLSMGGGIALSFTLSFPDQVEKLVLVDSHGIIDANVFPRWLYLMIYFYVHHPFLNELIYRYVGTNRKRISWQLLASNVVHRADHLSPQVIDQVIEHVQLPGRGKAFTSWQQSETKRDGLRTCLIDRLHEITVPTLIINGEKDKLIPLAYAQKAHQLIPGSRLVVLNDCGHWPQRELPDEFNRAISSFLGI